MVMFKKIKLIALGMIIALNINVGLVGAVSDIEKGGDPIAVQYLRVSKIEILSKRKRDDSI